MTDNTELKLNVPIGGMSKASIPLLGKAVKTAKEGVYAVREQAVVGKQYLVLCPVCGKPVLVKASEPRVVRVMHKTCNVPIIIKVGTAEPQNDGHSHQEDGGVVLTNKNVALGSKTNAKLSWWSLTGRKQFVLRIGKNYVGRKDSESPSDLSLKDEYVSARSICIEVNKAARGYSFHLTVERATNPVFINGKEQPEGSSFDLNYGDIIKLGNTSLTFNPVKK
ncbi:MAG: FHA domain-containing protein [Prevotella sp.]|nr:FHA domain-containing protein [Prevotella sp.]